MRQLTDTTSIQEISAEEYNQNILEIAKKKYKELRQRSKTITFALQYGGTEHTLAKNGGFSLQEAKDIVKNYKKLYYVSELDKQKHISEAGKIGYVLGAFGLRVRTPVIRQCILGLRNTPKEAEAEGRTASNARFQSYGLLNNRAGVEFNTKVRNSQYKLDIKPVAQIHDAQYFLVRDDEDIVLWANENLVQAVSWQDDPAIYHPEVKLGGEFSIFWPNWSKELAIPNIIDKPTLNNLVKDYIEKVSK